MDKTEKTMAELEIDMNVAYEFSSAMYRFTVLLVLSQGSTHSPVTSLPPPPFPLLTPRPSRKKHTDGEDREDHG
jgi:hypothetical protein